MQTLRIHFPMIQTPAGLYQLRMLVLDFDGTSADYEVCVKVHNQVMLALNRFIELGVSWMIASDRSMADFWDIIKLMDSQQRPTALLTQQRYIHFIDSEGEYYPHVKWNQRSSSLHKKLWSEISPHFDDWASIVKGRVETLVSIQDDESFGFVVAESDMQILDRILKELLWEFPSAKVTGNHNSRIVLHKSFSKALIVHEACRTLCLGSNHVFTIGDGINDLSMMEETVCRSVGCPADACEEVLDRVLSRGGITSEVGGPEGTADVLMQLLSSQLSEGTSSQ